MKKTIEHLAQYIVLLIVIILPLQSLWLRIGERYGVTGKPFFFLSFWYEIAIFLLFVVTLITIPKLRFKFTRLDWAFLAVLVWGVISYFWAEHSISAHIIGMRYSMLPVYAYFAARLGNVTEDTLIPKLRIIFWLVIAFGALQLLAWLLVPNYLFLTKLGLEITHRIVAIPQLYGTLPGPNQFGIYLVLIITLTSLLAFPNRRWLAALSLVFLALTFSRSALLALIVSMIGYFLLRRDFPAIGKNIIPALAVLALVWVGLSYFLGGRLDDLITHGASQNAHLQAMKIALFRFLHDGSYMQMLAGYGAGEAGPATFVTSHPFIPESWYLQILYEFGLIGLLLFGGAFWLTIRESIEERRYAITTSVIAMLVGSLFLHPLSDNPAVASLLFILVATLNQQPLLYARHPTNATYNKTV